MRRILRSLIPSRPAGIGPARALYVTQAAYLAVLLGFFVVKGVGVTPDIIFLFLAFGFALKGARWTFVRDFGPFVLLLLSYDALRGFADDLGGRVHVTYPIAWDRALFGEVPTVTLQRWLFDPDNGHWYDYAAALMHVMHFVVPLLFAAVLWQHYRQHYWRFVVSLVVMSYAGFVTYILLPTAPPWYAGLTGDLPGVQLVHEALPALGAIYRFLSPNEVAAMPSLHAAYAWLFLMFGVRIWGWKAAPFALYVAAMYFSIVYLGHHYVVDILGGIAYAVVAYVLCATDLVAERVSALWRRLRPAPAAVEALALAEREAA